MEDPLRVRVDARADWIGVPPAGDRGPVGARGDRRCRQRLCARAVVEQRDSRGRGRSRNAVFERRQNLIGQQMMARIAIPAALAWFDAHSGSARPAGRVEANDADAGIAARILVPVPGAARTLPPAWITARTDRAVEAIVIATAREGWRVGASCFVEPWRRGWAGYAEMGAVAWHANSDPRAPIDADTWSAMERSLGGDGLEERSPHPALAATSAPAGAAARGCRRGACVRPRPIRSRGEMSPCPIRREGAARPSPRSMALRAGVAS